LAAGSRDKGKSTACNNWDYTGSCSYWDRCKFSHDTEPGCKGTNAKAHADADKLEEDGLLEGDTTGCNNCIEPDCKGCGQKHKEIEYNPRISGMHAIKARMPGMHAIGWKQQLGMNWAQMAAADEN
jgi:hypothetical protein